MISEALCPDLDASICAELAAADPYAFVKFLLESKPHASAKELQAELVRLGGPHRPKAEISRWREKIRDEMRLGPGADQEAKPSAQKRYEAALATGNAQAALQWARAAQLEQEAGIATLSEDPDALDLSGLTDVQFSAYNALVSIARGEAMTDETAYWVAVFARVPEPDKGTHPAHVPLPDIPLPKSET